MSIKLGTIYTQIDRILSLFGKKASDYPIYVHVIPTFYFILYTFLIHHAILDLVKVREDNTRKKRIESIYVTIFMAIYVISFLVK